ncbi:glutamate synthase subunit beta [Nautilia sp.]
MQNFIQIKRIDPSKKPVNERVNSYEEIYNLYKSDEAASQAGRCIQCGDPYCHTRCPLHNYIPFWLKAVNEGDLQKAFYLSNESSPFPEIMGRVCPQDRLCEGACTLNDGYGAITIGSIEKYITEEGFKQGFKLNFKPVTTNKKVAIIGSGPAGLSIATFLLRAGIAVDVYEKEKRAGGLLTYGIPNFKLDKNVVQRRVDMLIKNGMNLITQTTVGKDISFDEIYEKYDAVFVGVGAKKSRMPGIENENAKNAYPAMKFLVNIQNKLFGEKCDIDVNDKKVLVIGGGDTAMDCVRTAIREKALKVTCAYRRDEKSMPGSRKEFYNAKEEGAKFIFNATPKRVIVNEDYEVIGVEMQKTEIKDKKVEIVPNSEFIIKCDIVIFALGFSHQKLDFLKKYVEFDKWGAIKVDKNYQTKDKKIFAGGDAIRGADLVVTAARDGREAAKAIYNLLTEKKG